jgi:hypothetical protein
MRRRGVGFRVSLDDRWQDGVRRVAEARQSLPERELARLGSLCTALMGCKVELQRIASRADAASRCADCGGACCVTGKYHFTPVDLLVYLAAGEPLFVPLFENGVCPYLGVSGCLMRPEFRPFNCITFNCELIEDRLAPEQVARFYELERELRLGYRAIRSLFPAGALAGVLL